MDVEWGERGIPVPLLLLQIAERESSPAWIKWHSPPKGWVGAASGAEGICRGWVGM